MQRPYPAPGTPLAFSRALNFRELGGYPADGGRTVRHGLLWRSGALQELDAPEDRALYASLGIRYVLDLRSTLEAAASPDLILPGARYENICAMRYADGSEIDFSPAGLQRLAQEAQRLEKQLGRRPNDDDMFLYQYRCMPFGNPAYRALFAAMEAGEVPLLFHCAAGKDRTGVAAMLILLALGASRETALWDYMHTNVCRKPAIDAFLAQHAAEYAAADAHGREMLQSFEGVSLTIAESTLDTIEARYPSYAAFFAAEYGLDAARLAALRGRYLE